jgi:Carboxypeptidase regulatory-like domain/TonB-dependent Receptor Plug Domain
MKLKSGWVFLLIVLVLWVPSLIAQTAATGALTGTVTDPSGGVVPNATVTATNLDTGQARTTKTASDGVYKIGLLPPGNYKVRLEAAGFTAVEVPSVGINVTETEVLDRALDVSSQTQAVTVEAEVEAIQTASSALGTVASARVITELPLNTRNYTNLLTMSAGANSAVTNAAFIGKGSTLIAVNGGGTAQNTYLQDGVPINNWFSFNTGAEGVEFGSFAIPIPDAIAEFKIQTSTYDAGYGRNPGANVNVVTKSGSNNFHGTAFEFFRNTALNANDWFRNFSGQPKAVFNSNQYGGAVGGPIKKDKLFFFASYQETSQTNGITGYGTASLTLPPLPTGDRGSCPAGWNGNLALCTGNAAAFIQNLATNVSPGAPCSVSAGRAVTANSVQVLCPANGAGAPLYNINPVAISLLQLKLPNGNYLVPSPSTGKFTQTIVTDPAKFKDHNGMGNFDYVYNAKHTVSGRYAYEQDPINGPFPALNVTQITNAVPGHPVLVNKFNHAALLRLTSILTPNLVNEARISYQRNNTIARVSSPFTNSGVGITSLTATAGVTPLYDTLSNFMVGSGSGGFSFGPYYLFNGNFPENQYEWADQVSWTHGKHSFRTGFEAERVGLSRNYFGLQAGGPTFSSFGDFLIGRAGCGPGIINAGCNGGTASNMSSTGMTSPSPTGGFNYSIRVTDLNAFVQDDIKLTSRLTVNLGVRWEYDGLPYLTDGNFSNYLPSLALKGSLPTTPATGTLAGFIVPSNYTGPVTAGLTKNNNRSAIPGHVPYSDFAPRIGFAWQPTSSNRWVLRGGAGFFYDLVGGVLFADNNPGNTAPGVLPTAVPPSAATLANPWVLPSVVIPGAPGTIGFTPLWVNPANNTSSNMAQVAVQENLTVPLTYEWNLNTQYEFLSNWVLELGYVGSHGIHQLLQSAAGFQGQGSATPFNVAQLAGTGSPCVSCSIYNVTTNSPQNVVLRVPNLGISPTATSIETEGSYKFNSLQATVRKQLSYGLQLQAAYTWSRGFITQAFGLNTYPYFALQYGLNPNYRPHRFVLSYVWNLPLGRPKGVEGVLLSGWSWSGVTTIQNGNPLNITDATAGSDFVGGNGFASATPQFCAGKSSADIATTGSLTQRVTSGLTPGGAGYLNGKAQGVFCAPPTGGIFGTGTGFGNAGLGLILGPGQNNWDMSLSKSFNIRESQTLQFRSEFFDTFNHPQFSLPNTVASAASGFGQIASTSVSPRIIQLALKYSF